MTYFLLGKTKGKLFFVSISRQEQTKFNLCPENMATSLNVKTNIAPDLTSVASFYPICEFSLSKKVICVISVIRGVVNPTVCYFSP